LTRAKKFITEAEQIFTLKNDHFGLFEVDKTNIDILYKSKDINGLYKSAKSLVNRVINFKDNQGEQRTKRANTIVQVDNQNKVIDILAKDNTKQQKELNVTKKSVQEQNTYLTLLVLFCLSLSILFIWLLFLLRKIRVLANTDVLTGITNRRHGLELAEKRLNKKKQSTLCIAIMDLDEFKSVNDTYGHDIGDKVIQLAVSQSQVALNEDDIFCRMGGEEFMYILSDTDQIKTIQRLNKIRESIFQSDTHSLGINRQISASFGATHVSETQNKKSLTDYMIEADIALYKAKTNGRNQLQS
jgi:diguanylate cyclase (GGDEF)-like protein